MIFSKGVLQDKEVISPASTEEVIEEPFVDPIAILKKNVSDTLTFLHQERNDFLPEEDIIIPSRKHDHISQEIDLNCINLKPPRRSTSDYDDSFQDNIDTHYDVNIIQDVDPFIEYSNKNYDVQNVLQNDVKLLDDNLRSVVESEVTEVIKQAEHVVNNKLNSLNNSVEDKSNKVIRFQEEILENLDNKVDSTKETADSIFDELKTTTEDSLDNLESLKDDSISAAQEKSEEAFKFLENEVSSSNVSTPLEDSLSFIQREVDSTFSNEDPSKIVSFSNAPVSPKSPRSNIPIPKVRKSLEKEKDIDVLFNEERSDSISPTDSELLSKIPVAMKVGKVKTIKKHSKDPLKEFVTLSKDVNWDDDEETTKIIRTVTSDPIVKTTVTRITSENLPEHVKSKIPVLQTESLSPSEMTERYDIEVSPKSKIPVLKTETTRIISPEGVEKDIVSPDSTRIIETTTTIVSPGSRVSTKSSTIDSDSDDDSRRSPPLKGILKKTSVRTIGSSSGSDVALHEEGAELSDDDSGMSSILNTFHFLNFIVALSKLRKLYVRSIFISFCAADICYA